MYSTYDFAEEGKKAGDVSSSSKSILVVSIITFVIQCININIVSKTGKNSCNIVCEVVFLFLFLGAEVALLATLIAMYASTISNLQTLNIEMFRFALDYKCSDGPMQRVMKFIVDDY